jgi:uncharacterized membrane protein
MHGLPWFKIQGDREAQNVLILATLAMMGMRWFNTNAFQGISLHFLCAGVATLMFGARFALWVTALVSLVAWPTNNAWHGPFFDFLATGAIPIAVVSTIAWGVLRWLPTNLFVYVLCTAFGGGAISIAISNLFKAAMTTWIFQDVPSWPYLIATPMLMFGEGFFCGGIIVMVVVYRPQWCISFDDERYLSPPPPEA